MTECESRISGLGKELILSNSEIAIDTVIQLSSSCYFVSLVAILFPLLPKGSIKGKILLQRHFTNPLVSKSRALDTRQ